MSYKYYLITYKQGEYGKKLIEANTVSTEPPGQFLCRCLDGYKNVQTIITFSTEISEEEYLFLKDNL